MRYTQKDLCRAFDIRRDTLRHYERLGIIRPQIDAKNGYRYYDDWQINLLWECKRYQAMGFSLAQVHDILHHSSLAEVESSVNTRLGEMERELAYRTMALECMRAFREKLRDVEERLGRYEMCTFPAARFVARREVHHLLLDEHMSEAGSFVNQNQAVCLPPMAYFPDAHEERYFWGFAMTVDHYETLGGPKDGFVELPAYRALTTCVDAGERWGFGQRLFEGLLGEAERLGERPVGPLYGLLLSRTYDASGSYHRYVEAYLPLVD